MGNTTTHRIKKIIGARRSGKLSDGCIKRKRKKVHVAADSVENTTWGLVRRLKLKLTRQHKPRYKD